MAHPARVGQLVLWNSTYSVEQLPAIIVSIPLYVVGGGANDDGAGNPLVVDLLAFSMSGSTSQYRVPSADTYEPSTWSPLPAE